MPLRFGSQLRLHPVPYAQGLHNVRGTLCWREMSVPDSLLPLIPVILTEAMCYDGLHHDLRMVVLILPGDTGIGRYCRELDELSDANIYVTNHANEHCFELLAKD